MSVDRNAYTLTKWLSFDELFQRVAYPIQIRIAIRNEHGYLPLSTCLPFSVCPAYCPTLSTNQRLENCVSAFAQFATRARSLRGQTHRTKERQKILSTRVFPQPLKPSPGDAGVEDGVARVAMAEVACMMRAGRMPRWRDLIQVRAPKRGAPSDALTTSREGCRCCCNGALISRSAH
jgi:hypothetical protein